MKMEKLKIKQAKNYLAAIRGEFLEEVAVKRYLEVAAIRGSLYRKTMGKRLGPSVSGRYLEVAAIRGSTVYTKYFKRYVPTQTLEGAD